MEIKRFNVGSIMTNCYFVGDENTKKGFIVDPGDEGERLGREWANFGYELEGIFLTHGHYDHTGAIPYFAEHFPNIPIYVNQQDVFDGAAQSGKPQFWQCVKQNNMHFIKDGDVICIGTIPLQVLETPGHTPGSLVFKSTGALFTGDTLFAGSCGRVDFPGGNFKAMLASLRRLNNLEGNFDVYPGHEWTTNLDEERRYNCFIKQAMSEV